MQLSGDLVLVNENNCNTANKTYLSCYLVKSRAESLIYSKVPKIYNAMSFSDSLYYARAQSQCGKSSTKSK